MKKLIIIAVAVILIATATIATLSYLNSFQKVSVTLSGDVTSAALYKVNPEEGHNHEIVGKPLQTIDTNTELSLQNGTYYFIPEGEKVAKDEVNFTVKDAPVSVELNPDYSKEYLAEVLKTEEAAIIRALKNNFPSQMKNYRIQQGTIYEKADWYGALLIRNVSDPRDQRDYYRVVMHKENDQWNVVKTPQLVLTASEFKGVPVDVLRSVNELTPSSDL